MNNRREVPSSAVERASDAVPIDNLDGYYAVDVISKLERIVRLVAALEAVKTDLRPAPKVSEYFMEAHNCFLYGFPVACAVLCRALLEAVLNARYEPDEQDKTRKPSRELTPKQREGSAILNWLDRALREKILDGSRVEAGENIKDAGDWAIHWPQQFRAQWGRDDQLRVLVDDTRKVLEDLHRAS